MFTPRLTEIANCEVVVWFKKAESKKTDNDIKGNQSNQNNKQINDEKSAWYKKVLQNVTIKVVISTDPSIIKQTASRSRYYINTSNFVSLTSSADRQYSVRRFRFEANHYKQPIDTFKWSDSDKTNISNSNNLVEVHPLSISQSQFAVTVEFHGTCFFVVNISKIYYSFYLFLYVECAQNQKDDDKGNDKEKEKEKTKAKDTPNEQNRDKPITRSSKRLKLTK